MAQRKADALLGLNNPQDQRQLKRTAIEAGNPVAGRRVVGGDAALEAKSTGYDAVTTDKDGPKTTYGQDLDQKPELRK